MPGKQVSKMVERGLQIKDTFHHVLKLERGPQEGIWFQE
jgi:hypothetical protein